MRNLRHVRYYFEEEDKATNEFYVQVADASSESNTAFSSLMIMEIMIHQHCV